MLNKVGKNGKSLVELCADIFEVILIDDVARVHEDNLCVKGYHFNYTDKLAHDIIESGFSCDKIFKFFNKEFPKILSVDLLKSWRKLVTLTEYEENDTTGISFYTTYVA